jgi:hypothetical protein
MEEYISLVDQGQKRAAVNGSKRNLASRVLSTVI